MVLKDAKLQAVFIRSYAARKKMLKIENLAENIKHLKTIKIAAKCRIFFKYLPILDQIRQIDNQK